MDGGGDEVFVDSVRSAWAHKWTACKVMRTRPRGDTEPHSSDSGACHAIEVSIR